MIQTHMLLLNVLIEASVIVLPEPALALVVTLAGLVKEVCTLTEMKHNAFHVDFATMLE